MVLESILLVLSFNVIQMKDRYQAQGEQSLIPMSYDFLPLRPLASFAVNLLIHPVSTNDSPQQMRQNAKNGAIHLWNGISPSPLS